MGKARTKTRSKAGAGADKFHPCTLRFLPDRQQIEAAKRAAEINPANLPATSQSAPTKAELAALVTKMWPAGGVKLGVAFMDGGSTDLKAKILGHMNAWSATANVAFEEVSRGNAQVRISRTRGWGYWSYLGVDALSIYRGEPTMNLDSFSTDTPEQEYRRVVRHETGHALGFPHEHLRRELIQRLDPAKTIRYFRDQYGWSEAVTRSNVLTPLEEASIRGTPEADEDSIMAYTLPGSITRDGNPIQGGDDINALDAAFCGQLYPLPSPPPPPPPAEAGKVVVLLDQKAVRLPPGWAVLPPAG